MRRSLILILCLVVLGSCDVYTQDEYQEQYAIEMYLVANDSLPSLRLSTTSAIDEEYSLSENFVEGADVQLRLLNSDSTVAETYPYMGRGDYIPVNDSVTVRAGRMYQLHITVPDGEVVSSITRVPGDFESVNELKDIYYFEQDDPIKVVTTPSEYPGRPTYYISNVNAVNPKKERLTPFFYDLVEQEGMHPGVYWKNSYGIMNEDSYRHNEDGTITITYPWLTVAFYGQNDLVVNAIDDNLYDFIRTQSSQSAGSASLLTGKLRNIEYNIKGGVGIFGSMATDTSRVTILPPEEQ